MSMKTPKVSNKEIADYKREYQLIFDFGTWYYLNGENSINTLGYDIDNFLKQRKK